MSSGRKSIAAYYAKPTPKTILTGAIFDRHPQEVGNRALTYFCRAAFHCWKIRLPAAELAARRRTARATAPAGRSSL